MNYFMIGDEDAVLGFGMVGVQGRVARTPEERPSRSLSKTRMWASSSLPNELPSSSDLSSTNTYSLRSFPSS